MRKSTLSVLISAFSFSLSAQTYIQFDAQNMDRFEYKYLQPEPNNVAYTTYRLNKNQSEKLYFETSSVESQVVINPPNVLTQSSEIWFSRNDIGAINRGEMPVFLCKKLDSGWLITPITAAAFMTYDGANLVYQGTDFDLKADFTQSLVGYNLNQSNGPNMSEIVFSGQIDACNQIASVFKKAPNASCPDGSTLTIIPNIGLVQNLCENGQKTELVSINGISVCDYLAQYNAPTVIASTEPTPENIPTQYSMPVVNDKPISTADFFGEDISARVTNTPIASTTSTTEIALAKATEPISIPKVDCNAVAREGEHVVNQGESLYSIARRYGIAVNSIRSWNNLSADVIYPCSIIKVVAPQEPTPQPSMTEARTQDVPMSYISEAKKEQPKETPKETLNETPVVKVVKKSDCDVVALDGEHVVQKGESLYAISRLYNVKVEQLRTWNTLKNDVISPCQKLLISEAHVQVKSVPESFSTVVKPQSTTAQPTVAFVKKEDCMHVVKKGETLSKLSKQFGIKEADLRKYNNLGNDDKILIGQVLRKQSAPCFVDEELPKTYSVAIKPKSAVKKGETEVQLQPATSTAVPKKEDVPQAYSTVVMPKPIKVQETGVTAKSVDLKARKYYIAQENDTVQSIAKAYGLTVEKLRSLNNLEPNEAIVKNQLLNLE